MEQPLGQPVSSVSSHIGDAAVQLCRSTVGSAVGRDDGFSEGAREKLGLGVGLSVGDAVSGQPLMTRTRDTTTSCSADAPPDPEPGACPRMLISVEYPVALKTARGPRGKVAVLS